MPNDFSNNTDPVFWSYREKELNNTILKLKREVEILKLQLKEKEHSYTSIGKNTSSNTIISKDNRLLLSSIFLNNPSSIILSDANGKINLINNNACELFGYTNQEFLTKSIDDLVPIPKKEHAKLRQHYYKSPDQRGMGIGRDIHAKKKDGAIFPVEIGLNSIIIDQNRYTISVIVDLTYRNQLKNILGDANKKLVKEIESFKNICKKTKICFASIKENNLNVLYDLKGHINPLVKLIVNDTFDLSQHLSKNTLSTRHDLIKKSIKKDHAYEYTYNITPEDSLPLTLIEKGYLNQSNSETFTIDVRIYIENTPSITH